jgi:hypothetical protein
LEQSSLHSTCEWTDWLIHWGELVEVGTEKQLLQAKDKCAKYRYMFCSLEKLLSWFIIYKEGK